MRRTIPSLSRTAAYNVKVRLQTQPHDGARKNMMQMVAHVVKGDGFTGLYRGVRHLTNCLQEC